MPRKLNLVGQRFGKLIAVKELPPTTKGGNYRWECRCDCGNTVIVRGGALTSGHTKSCGCFRNLRNLRFGRLTALKPTGKKSGSNAIWLCQCECGNQIEVSTDNLRSGGVRSCGCLLREKARELSAENRKKLAQNEWKDGTCLHRLTAKTPTRSQSGRKGVYFNNRRNKYVAFITLRRKRKFLGYFTKFEDAVKARERAEEELFEPILNAHGRSLYEKEA